MNKYWLLLNILFFVFFNTLFFMVGGLSHNVSAWSGYGFIHFAFVAAATAPFVTERTHSRMILGMTTYVISLVYFLSELILGVAIIILNPISWKSSFLIQLFLLCSYLGFIIISMMANKHTETNEKSTKNALYYHKTMCANIQGLLIGCGSTVLKKHLEKLYDTARSSQLNSHSAVRELEEQVLEKIVNLEQAIGKNDEKLAVMHVEQLLVLVEKRSQQLRLLN